MKVLGAAATKKDLYKAVTELATANGFSFELVNYCVNAVALAKKVCRNLKIEYLDFKTLAFCGLMYKTEKSTSIALNSRRSAGGRNFDCMHELIHYWLHDRNDYQCFGGSDDYYEWQANEGAAQFLMPYQLFIPKFCQIEKTLNCDYISGERKADINRELSKRYFVGTQSVEIRVKSLGYEINQYKHGTPIDAIKILSNKQQNS
jgi:Zn-dependent peptidase ImmA (M78 family)